jgi:hypothetical protein
MKRALAPLPWFLSVSVLPAVPAPTPSLPRRLATLDRGRIVTAAFTTRLFLFRTG